MQIISFRQVALASLMVLLLLSTSVFATVMKAPVTGEWLPKEFHVSKLSQSNVKAAKLKFTVLEPVEQLAIVLILPDGVELKAGKLKQQLTSLSANQTIEIDYVFNLLAKDFKQIIVRVILADEENFKLSRSFVLPVNPKAKVKVKTYTTKSKDGKTLIVY